MPPTVIPARASDLRAIAIGCLYLLTGNGVLAFPGSGRSKPSLKVVVDHQPYRLFRREDSIYFPFWVRWDLWQNGVVPVLQNKDVQTFVMDNLSLRVEQNAILLHQKDYETYIDKIVAYLTASFIEAGYLPESLWPFPVVEEEVVDPSCEPIDRNPQDYPIDPTIQHPDGTPKLTYNVVDE